HLGFDRGLAVARVDDAPPDHALAGGRGAERLLSRLPNAFSRFSGQLGGLGRVGLLGSRRTRGGGSRRSRGGVGRSFVFSLDVLVFRHVIVGVLLLRYVVGFGLLCEGGDGEDRQSQGQKRARKRNDAHGCALARGRSRGRPP